MPKASLGLCVALCLLGASACRGSRQDARPQAPPSATSVRATTSAPTRSSSSAPGGPWSTATASPASEEPALFVRFGDALMPLGCKRGGTWKSGDACVGNAQALVRLHPGFQAEPEPAPATPALLEFPVSDTKERGLLLSGSKNPLIESSRPLLGFATRSVAAPLRFSSAARKRLETNAATWCAKGFCPGPLNSSMEELESRIASADEKRRATGDLRQALRSARGVEAKASVVNVLRVRVAGAPQELLTLEANARDIRGGDPNSELPSRVHFLLRSTPGGFRHLTVARDFDFELGEAGEPLAAVDLDGDGTDELVLEWRYSEGRWVQLVRFDGDRLVMIGKFGDGT